MSKASSVVTSITQQSRQEFNSLGEGTENARMPHEFRRYDGTTSWWPGWNVDDVSVPCHTQKLKHSS